MLNKRLSYDTTNKSPRHTKDLDMLSHAALRDIKTMNSRNVLTRKKLT